MKTPDFAEISTFFSPKMIRNLGKSYFYQLSDREIVTLNIVAALVGVIAGYAAIGFRYLIGFLENLILFGQLDYHMISPIEHIRGPWMFVIVPAGLLVSALITRYFAQEAKGHGVPEVIESVMARGGRIRKRVVALKALSSSLTIACGGSVGREGPIVQIGSAAGSTFGQILQFKPRLLKTLVGCGACGAIAATFNTPVAGVIFAIEIIILELKTRSFVPLVIASVFATVISRLYLGNEPAFIVPKHTFSNPQELIFYLALGIIAGVIGVLIIKFLYGMEDFFDRLRIPFWCKPIIGGLLIATIGLQYPQMFGVGYETISQTLQQNTPFSLMFLFIFLKILCMSLTLASGGSGGVFTPSLFVGAMLGGAYGYTINQFYPEIVSSHGAYALVGMAAVFSATSRATFTAIVILFEMTLDYSIILPLMFVCVTADQVAWALLKDSIYSLKLKRKGFVFETDIGVNIIKSTLIKDIMTTKLHIAHENMTTQEAANKLLHHGHAAYPVVNDGGELTGVLTEKCLTGKVIKHPKSLVKEIKEPVHTVVNTHDTVAQALSKIEKTRDPRIFVIHDKTKKLVGIVSPVDVVRLTLTDV